MITNNYENGFRAVKDAYETTEGLNEIIDYLREHPQSSVKEIRRALYLNKPEWMQQSLACHIASMLKTLRQNNMIVVDERQEAPIQIEVEDYVPIGGENLPPLNIEVFDKDGNKYEMPNPYYKTHPYKHTLQRVKKWIIPKTRIYTLIA